MTYMYYNVLLINKFTNYFYVYHIWVYLNILSITLFCMIISDTYRIKKKVLKFW